ncbi:MAG: DUF4920 domain-containing protein [bacterium]|nr:DUF4920 domain-containing protein [bacterium]
MRTARILLSTALALTCAAGALAGDNQTWGEGLTGESLVAISDLLDTPDAYVGKTVRVQGLVVGVCAHRGCWINLAGDQDGQQVRFKVQDGVMVFPPELAGDTVIAEGVWTANELTMEQTKKVCEARAEQTGETFDAAGVTECMTLYQISGTGAVVVGK